MLGHAGFDAINSAGLGSIIGFASCVDFGYRIQSFPSVFYESVRDSQSDLDFDGSQHLPYVNG
jgi:hypothetical protein